MEKKCNPCYDCPNADRTMNYSNWHYCDNPSDSRDFVIIRWRSDFNGKIINIERFKPKWCPRKKNKGELNG